MTINPSTFIIGFIHKLSEPDDRSKSKVGVFILSLLLRNSHFVYQMHGTMFQQIEINPNSTRNFSYIIGCDETKEAVVVDPAFVPDQFIRILQQENLTLTTILNTHGHHDHTNANEEVKQHANATIANHPADGVNSDMDLEHGTTLTIGKRSIKTFHTPGHSEGSCCFLVDEDILLTGDTLFVGKVGGTSNRGPDARQQYEAIHNKIMQLPDDVKVYPGHDYGPKSSSTIGWERKHNPFVRQNSFEAFCDLKANWEQEKSKWASYWEEL